MNKFLPILLLFAGEVFAILAEIIAAKYYALNGHAFAKTFIKLAPLLILGALLLLSGYMLGLKSFKNIWIVSAISIASILIAEPVINYTVTGQLPARGAALGLVFGILGIVSALFF